MGNKQQENNFIDIGDLVGKYIIYGVVIFIALFVLNWFEVIDIPFLDVPDFTESKHEMMTKSQDSLKTLK